MLNKSYVNHSPNLNVFKGQLKVTPPKMMPQTNKQDSTQMNSIGTNRSSVSGSTASHYNSINTKLETSYIGSKTRPITTTFEPAVFLDRGRNTPTTPNQSNTSVHFSGKKADSKPSTPTYKLQNQTALRNLSPLNLHKTTPDKPVVSSLSIKQRILRTTQDSDSLPACINHPQKKSKYRMPHDQSMSLCSKCAVTMVGQGFKVEEISEDQGRCVRRSEIDDFISQVTRQVPKAQAILFALSSKKEEVRRYYDQQRSKLNGLFSTLEETLHRQKHGIESHLQEAYSKAIAQYESHYTELQRSLVQTQNMQKDIQLNVDRIIEKIELQPFREIMQSYRSNLDSFMQKQAEVQRHQVEILRITVPDIDQRLQALLGEIDIAAIKTSLVKRSSDLPPKPSESSFYVSFENRDQFHAKFKRSAQQDENQDTSNYENPAIRIATVQLYEADRTRREREQPFQRNDSFEEGHSQMIEKEDIENNYNMILCDNESEQEEIASHLQEMGRREQVPLFCSPQFKDH